MKKFLLVLAFVAASIGLAAPAQAVTSGQVGSVQVSIADPCQRLGSGDRVVFTTATLTNTGASDVSIDFGNVHVPSLSPGQSVVIPLQYTVGNGAKTLTYDVAVSDGSTGAFTVDVRKGSTPIC